MRTKRNKWIATCNKCVGISWRTAHCINCRPYIVELMSSFFIILSVYSRSIIVTRSNKTHLPMLSVEKKLFTACWTCQAVPKQFIILWFVYAHVWSGVFHVNRSFARSWYYFQIFHQLNWFFFLSFVLPLITIIVGYYEFWYKFNLNQRHLQYSASDGNTNITTHNSHSRLKKVSKLSCMWTTSLFMFHTRCGSINHTLKSYSNYID